MKHDTKYHELSKPTGLPTLAAVNDLERLERLVEAANTMRANASRQCPLRLKVAYRLYARAAQYRLEHPEEIR